MGEDVKRAETRDVELAWRGCGASGTSPVTDRQTEAQNFTSCLDIHLR